MTVIRPEQAAGPRRGRNQVSQLAVPVGELTALVSNLAGTPGVRLADVFAAGDDPIALRLVWALDDQNRYLVTESEVQGAEYPALSDITPAAFSEECEIHEQFGIRPAGGKPLNRVAVPPQAGPDFPRLGRRPLSALPSMHAPHHVGGQAFEFPFGPVRQVAMESLYYGLVTSGEELVDLYLFTWHKHRGVEWRAQGRDPAQALFHVERMEGLGAIGNSWAFAAAAETALDIEPADAELRSRAVALELERLYNHAAATAALCQACGLAVGRAAAEIALELFLRLNAEVFGHRYLFGVVGVGGARTAPDIDALKRGLPGAYDELRRAAEDLLQTNSLMDRLEATGIMTAEAARRLGLVGPVARGCGVLADTRTDHPAPPYAELRPAVACQDGGDVLARFRVMLAEAAESVRLIDGLLEQGTAASLVAPPARASHGYRTGLGWAESSRGESLAWLELGPDGTIRRARLRPAAVRNWRGFDDACRSQNVFTDIPIIEASFWLTVAGTAR
ncbi:MAG: hypothetical protein ACRDRJ_05290 [Streptosporangiaceae bacterium]